MKSSTKTIFLASDHAGYELKQQLHNYLIGQGFTISDLGTHNLDSVDYPDYAELLAVNLLDSPGAIGILICGTGIGMSIAANRYSHVRAALCHNTEYARLAREHNNANVLVLGARFIDNATAYAISDVFLITGFSGGRHASRVDKLIIPIL